MAAISSFKSLRSAVPCRLSRSTVVVRASSESVDRRAIFGAAAAMLASVPLAAQAITIPSQESTGGMLVGKGNMTKSPSGASMEGYTLEGFPGTKKPSFIEPGKKKALRARARDLALKDASPSK